MTENEERQVMDMLLEMEKDSPGLIDRLVAFGEMKEAGADFSELDNLIKRYIPVAGSALWVTVIDLFMRMIEGGMSQRATLVAIRLGLSMEYEKPEYFGVDDVSAALGVSDAEAEALIQQQDGRCTVAPAPWLTELLQ